MFSLLYVLPAILLAAGSSAMPTTRALSNCTVSNVAPFGLVASFTATGTNLSLVIGGDDDPYATEGFLATSDTVPFNLGFEFNMTHNLLTTNGINNAGNTPIPKNSMTVSAGGFLTFAATAVGAGPVYCLVPPANPYPLLAVNDDTTGFSVCHDSVANSSQYSVVWKAEEGSSLYDYSTCEKIDIYIVQ